MSAVQVLALGFHLFLHAGPSPTCDLPFPQSLSETEQLLYLNTSPHYADTRPISYTEQDDQETDIFSDRQSIGGSIPSDWQLSIFSIFISYIRQQACFWVTCLTRR